MNKIYLFLLLAVASLSSSAQDCIGTVSLRRLCGTLAPNGNVRAVPGEVYQQRATTTTGKLWWKATGNNTNTGWVEVGQAGGLAWSDTINALVTQSDLSAAGAAVWRITGNSGTTPGTHFIGTTDAKDLVFKTNGVVSGRIVKGGPGIGSGSTSLGYQSLLVNAGSSNTAFGSQAGRAVTSGTSNSIFGQSAGLELEDGDANTIIGDLADVTTPSTNNTTIVGYRAHAADNSVSIGYAAGELTTSGTGNVLVGVGAGQSATTASGLVIIGNDAGSDLTGNHNTIIGNSAGDFILSGVGNTLLGENSGETLTTGSRNVLIGQNADVAAAASRSAIAIGYGAIAASNQFKISDSIIVVLGATNESTNLGSATASFDSIYGSGISLNDGAVGNLSVKVGADENNGLYGISDSQLGFAVEGALVGLFNASGLATGAVNEQVTNAGVLVEGALLRDGSVTTIATGFAVNADATITAEELCRGMYLTSTSAAAVALTLPTAANIYAELGNPTKASFDFYVDNSAGANTVTVTLPASITTGSALTGGDDLTVAATEVGVFRLVIINATEARIYRLG